MNKLWQALTGKVPPVPPRDRHVDIIQYDPVHAGGTKRTTHAINGPEWSTSNVGLTDLNEDYESQCTAVDLNVKLHSSPQAYQPTPRQAVVEYYKDHPIEDHVQCIPPLVATLVTVGGETLWTSTKEVSDLEEILVKDLSWPKRHIGRSVLCRVLTRCRVHHGISFLVEDQQSQVIPVTIRHPFPFPAIVYSPSDVQTMWPIGTCLYIKEPYVRMGARGGQEILVAWPKDMVEVPRVAGVFDHPDVQPASNNLGLYRLAAAVAFSQNKVKLAIRLASIAVNLASFPHFHDKSDENDLHYSHILIGRALAYCVNRQPGRAYSDSLEAEHVLKWSALKNIVSLSRRVSLVRLQATYSLGMFTIASQHLAECEQAGVHSSVLQPFREAIRLRNAEMKGRFSKERDLSASLSSDRAMYIGPIKVVVDPIKGRTVVTTRPVKSGELLLAENPIVALEFNGSPGVTSLTRQWKQLANLPSPHAVSWTIHQIMDDPSIGQCVHSLVPTANIEDGNLGITDEERLAIFRDPCEIEVDLLARQLSRNSFGAEGTFTLYGLGSMINHSCKTNLSSCGVHGSTTFQRALNDMAKGEELLTCYLDPYRTFESRHPALERNWYFDCNCTLCKDDKTAGDQHRLRAKIMTDEWPLLKQEAASHTENVRGSSLPKVKSIITRLVQFASRIDATYAPGRTAELDLSQVFFALADLWAPHSASGSLSCYETGFRHIEWEFYTIEEMRANKKGVRRYGFVDNATAMMMINRLRAMSDLYRQKRLDHAASAMANTVKAFGQQLMPPTVDLT